MKKLSCIILDYKKAEKVLQNIEGLCSQKTEFSLEILIGDNSECVSNATILQKGVQQLETKYPDASFHVHIFPKNLGYTIGNNKLVQQSSGEMLCILNPDIHWKATNVLQTLWDKMKADNSIGIIAPDQKELPHLGNALSVRSFPSLPIQIARRTFLRHIPFIKPLVEKDEMKHINRTHEQSVDWLQSSFFMLDKTLWETMGGFDERYFLFMADTQLCRDCWAHEKKVWYFPKVQVYSDGLRCSDGGILSLFTSKTLRIHIIDSIKYYLRNR